MIRPEATMTPDERLEDYRRTTPLAEQLIDAAGDGDLQEMARILDQGCDINAFGEFASWM